MIEFKGYVTGSAEKFFWNYSKKIVLKLFIGVFLVLFPFIIYIAVAIGLWEILIAYFAVFAISSLTFLIPKTKKEKEEVAPHVIFIEDEYIVCKGKDYEEFILIENASKLIDYGEFYHVVFPAGKISDKFICQKDLLTKGTLSEFEELFEGKIERRTTT